MSESGCILFFRYDRECYIIETPFKYIFLEVLHSYLEWTHTLGKFNIDLGLICISAIVFTQITLSFYTPATE